jgi:hypothetical protein
MLLSLILMSGCGGVGADLSNVERPARQSMWQIPRLDFENELYAYMVQNATPAAREIASTAL